MEETNSETYSKATFAPLEAQSLSSASQKLHPKEVTVSAILVEKSHRPMPALKSILVVSCPFKRIDAIPSPAIWEQWSC